MGTTATASGCGTVGRCIVDGDRRVTNRRWRRHSEEAVHTEALHP